ncbi:MAG: PD-(D/E)XK nuclease-like domain-containing protein [Rickettsiaceae bacterium]|nr:PD-(D/E)XK nuclease-like domain-containing protein [Rickettsiaceae bacterium]
MPKLTLKNYYTPKNNYLTSSKLKDYIKDPYYFYQKHITHEITETLDTPSVKIGSAVDCYLTRSASIFNKTYQRKVTKKENPDLYEYQQIAPENLLTPAEYERTLGIIDAVKRTTLYKDIKKNFKKQVILQHEMPLGPFQGLAGALDFYKVEGGLGIVIDLKTTQSVDQRKFGYQAIDMLYYFQQAVYGKLLEFNFPEIKRIKHYILAVENNVPYRVAFYKLDDNEIQFNRQLLFSTLDEIRKLKVNEYKPIDLTWNDVKDL